MSDINQDVIDNLVKNIMYAINKTRTFVEIEKKYIVVIMYVVSALFYMGVVLDVGKN